MPSHTHGLILAYGANDPYRGLNYGTTVAGTFTSSINKAGGDKPHQNMPPFATLYMWKRTA